MIVATNVPLVTGILAGVVLATAAVGFAVGRWWWLGIIAVLALVPAFAYVVSPDEEGSIRLLWWLMLYPAVAAIAGTAIGIAARVLRTRPNETRGWGRRRVVRLGLGVVCLGIGAVWWVWTGLLADRDGHGCSSQAIGWVAFGAAHLGIALAIGVIATAKQWGASTVGPKLLIAYAALLVVSAVGVAVGCD